MNSISSEVVGSYLLYNWKKKNIETYCEEIALF